MHIIGDAALLRPLRMIETTMIEFINHSFTNDVALSIATTAVVEMVQSVTSLYVSE